MIFLLNFESPTFIQKNNFVNNFQKRTLKNGIKFVVWKNYLRGQIKKTAS